MATRVAAEVKASHDADAALIRSGGGVFQVRVDGRLVYDKAQQHRFPDEGEVSKLLA